MKSDNIFMCGSKFDEAQGNSDAKCFTKKQGYAAQIVREDPGICIGCVYASEPKADPKEKELNDDLNRVKRWAAKKLAIAEEIEFEDREDALFNKGYMQALEDIIMEIEMRES